MAVHVGTDPAAVYVGDQAATVYVGDQQVWPPDDPPVEELTRFGSTLVGAWYDTTWDYEQEIALPGTGGGTATPSNVGRLGCVRIFEGSNNNTNLANRSLNARGHAQYGLGSDVPVLLSGKFTEDDASEGTIVSYLQSVQAIAEKRADGTEFLWALDAEYDRRPWVANYPAKLAQVRALQLVHAPDLTVVLNPSGYLFGDRIDDVWPEVEGLFDILAPSFYVYGGTAAQNGSYAEFAEAHAFAAQHGLRFATYEWGVSKTLAGGEVVSSTVMDLDDYDPEVHGEHLEEAVEFLASFSDPHVEFAPYFESDTWATNIGDCRLAGTGIADVYGATVATVTPAP